MNANKLSSTLLLGLIFSPLLMSAPEESVAAEGEPPFLSLYDALTEALANNLDLEAERLIEEGVREDELIARAPFDPRIEVRTTQSTRQQSRAASELDGAAQPREETFNTRAILRQRTTPGTQLSLTTTLNRRDTNSDRASLNPASDADVSLDITQPLLRNRGRAVNRADIEKSLIEQDRAWKNLQARAMDLALDVEIAYYGIAVAKEEVRLRELNLQISEQLLEDSRLRREAGAGTRLDMLRAEVRVANNKESLLQSQQSLQNRRDELLDLIGTLNTEEDFSREFRVAPLEVPENVETEVARSLQKAMANDPQRERTELRLEQLSIDETVARNRRQPNLDIGGNLSFTGREEGFGRAFEELSEGRGYFWQVNLSLSMPWGFREERARYRQARLNLQRENVLLQRIDQSLLVEARRSIRAVETAQERLQVSQLGTSLSEEQLELERERYQAGAGTSRDVLDAQEDFETARLQQLRAQRDLREALSRLQRFEGLNLAAYGLLMERM
ncbi:MAG: TolC family protein [Opitutales bacterium]|nr:TolC family protein [Opitutales bacterium]MCH8541177.1 TolC family protein [Opitutales bacterium]